VISHSNLQPIKHNTKKIFICKQSAYAVNGIKNTTLNTIHQNPKIRQCLTLRYSKNTVLQLTTYKGIRKISSLTTYNLQGHKKKAQRSQDLLRKKEKKICNSYAIGSHNLCLFGLSKSIAMPNCQVLIMDPTTLTLCHCAAGQ